MAGGAAVLLRIDLITGSLVHVLEKNMSKRKCYDVSFKLEAIDCADKTSKQAAARKFGVDAKRLRVWCSQREELVALKKNGKSKKKRLTGAGRKTLDPDMEEALFSWIIELRGRNLRVSRSMIRVKARELSAVVGFKASRGWLFRFMKRNGLSLRRKTTVCQKTPADCIPKIISFITHLRTLRICHQYELHNIFAMDETACWMDMPSDTTVTTTGARSVPVKTTGHEKDHFTVILTAKADGTKMKPFIVFKGKGTRLIKELQRISGVVVQFSANGWMNDHLTGVYLRSVIGTFSFNKRLLVWDAYRCHTSVAVRSECAKLRLHTAVVPGGCTGYIQAADVVWNAPFKSHLRKHYDTWLADPTCHEYTRGGNMKPPSRSLLCQWVRSCWEAIPNEMVKESFSSCAITIHTDGSEDDKIHCFKPGQPCEQGRYVLEEADATATDSDSDPFAADEDDEEVENNEACIESEDEDNGLEEDESSTSEEL